MELSGGNKTAAFARGGPHERARVQSDRTSAGLRVMGCACQWLLEFAISVARIRPLPSRPNLCVPDTPRLAPDAPVTCDDVLEPRHRGASIEVLVLWAAVIMPLRGPAASCPAATRCI